jgi:hypothetical protein
LQVFFTTLFKLCTVIAQALKMCTSFFDRFDPFKKYFCVQNLLGVIFVCYCFHNPILPRWVYSNWRCSCTSWKRVPYILMMYTSCQHFGKDFLTRVKLNNFLEFMLSVTPIINHTVHLYYILYSYMFYTYIYTAIFQSKCDN